MNSTDAILAALENAPSIIVPMVREIALANLKRRPAPDVWSAHELACHLAVVHKLFNTRLDLMLRETNPPIKPYQPDQDDEEGALLKMDLDEALDRFVKDRQAMVARLKPLSPQDWQRTGQHPEYSHYSIFIMLRHAALHDMAHAYSIEELLLNPDWA